MRREQGTQKEHMGGDIVTIEYRPNDSFARAMAIAALNNPNMQNGRYSFRCVNSNLLSRTYHMPTSEGDVTVVVKNPFRPRFSKVLVTGAKNACRWHFGNLDELASDQELNSGRYCQA